MLLLKIMMPYNQFRSHKVEDLLVRRLNIVALNYQVLYQFNAVIQRFLNY